MRSLPPRNLLKCAVLCLRLGSGGAFAGFFLGTLLLGALLLAAISWNRLLSLGIEHALIGGLGAGIVGAFWGVAIAFGNRRSLGTIGPEEFDVNDQGQGS